MSFLNRSLAQHAGAGGTCRVWVSNGVSEDSCAAAGPQIAFASSLTLVFICRSFGFDPLVRGCLLFRRARPAV